MSAFSIAVVVRKRAWQKEGKAIGGGLDWTVGPKAMWGGAPVLIGNCRCDSAILGVNDVCRLRPFLGHHFTHHALHI
jgi:hypothetical protein